MPLPPTGHTAMSIREALSIMSEMVGSAIDGDCLDALKSVMDKANAAVAT
jgi:hypothetical protein